MRVVLKIVSRLRVALVLLLSLWSGNLWASGFKLLPFLHQFNVDAGGGLEGTSYWEDQQFTVPGSTAEFVTSASTLGVCGFLDFTKYVTATVGLRMAVGPINAASSAFAVTTSSSLSWSISQYDVGLEGKYPITFLKNWTVAPLLGILWSGYLGGQINGNSLNSSDQAEFSQLYFDAGLDMEYSLTQDLFVRVPLKFGVSATSHLPSSFYYLDQGGTITPGQYSASSNLILYFAVEVGHRF
ncbi:MAG: hypothetical protein HKM06_03200 [Spirochaetales bacterium]|nr:hypothetical protein [Spirochaetales bacterium]